MEKQPSAATQDPIPGTFSSKHIHPIPAHPHQAFYNPYTVYNPFYMPLAYAPPPHAPSPVPYTNLAIPPNPTYHHLLPYLDSLISQRRASNPHPHLAPTSAANLASGLRPENFVNVDADASFFCRTPSPANRQRTAQACLKCRERKTKCTGASPCARCTARGLVCTYVTPKDKDRATARNRAELRDDPQQLPQAEPPAPYIPRLQPPPPHIPHLESRTPHFAHPHPHPPIAVQAPTPVMFSQDMFARPPRQFLSVPASVPMLRG
ncbi:hypothetical protein NEOLEDRAFT_1132181 [Neolentinus lepideus HHB14362 ss-1]|uniref:Zn(2)-C6 fungal-type domain-containing protein n=1 Tax=Neolentinus lepideus HHB14362 ss-1 TaxID=1314782 RepID=A0A165TGG8_9AGAM|nr:hypothetical protein NEOLEDRAFT_1132181 [Neolentinus lepideus HHB14362 ss-1]